MSKVVCNYSVVRFLPYPETQEFANIGVVLACTSTGFFGYRLELNRRDRITHFFPELNDSIFIKGRSFFRDELECMRRAIAGDDSGQVQFSFNSDELKRAFLELVKPRESIFRFSPVRTLLADDPQSALDQLFDHYVERLFAQHGEYQEKVMARRLAQTLRRAQIAGYRAAKLGSDMYEVTFPLLRKNEQNDRDFRAIKPLDLNRAQTTQITDHGDAWLSRVRRLAAMNYDPSRMLFAVSLPPEETRKARAAEEIVRALRKQGASVLRFDETGDVFDFAKSA